MATKIVFPARTHVSTVSFPRPSAENVPCCQRLTVWPTELDLPEYESYEDLRQRLYTAMTAGSEYFGFA